MSGCRIGLAGDWPRRQLVLASFKLEEFDLYDGRGDAVLQRLHTLRDMPFDLQEFPRVSFGGLSFLLAEFIETTGEMPAECLEWLRAPQPFLNRAQYPRLHFFAGNRQAIGTDTPLARTTARQPRAVEHGVPAAARRAPCQP